MPLLFLTGDVDVASKPVATGCCPAALTRLPASIFATRHFAPGLTTETALPLIR
jgi:hypothetical protein